MKPSELPSLTNAEMWDAHAYRVLLFISRRLKRFNNWSRANLADVTAETRAAMLTATFKGQSSPWTWLCGIAKNKIADFIDRDVRLRSGDVCALEHQDVGLFGDPAGIMEAFDWRRKVPKLALQTYGEDTLENREKLRAMHSRQRPDYWLTEPVVFGFETRKPAGQWDRVHATESTYRWRDDAGGVHKGGLHAETEWRDLDWLEELTSLPATKYHVRDLADTGGDRDGNLERGRHARAVDVIVPARKETAAEIREAGNALRNVWAQAATRATARGGVAKRKTKMKSAVL